MAGKILRGIILIPLAILLIAFAVANRQTVVVSFDPFDAVQPAYALTLPLFAVIIVILILGVVIGGAAAWLRQTTWRSAARGHESEVRRLRAELEAARAREVRSRPAMADAADGAARTPLTIPPPSA
ncbi:MAG TPA: LapA family protein [Xanthobacteraceae bacterium]|nr:LapA family protein [Xanthobacteraceae bacterium]